MSPTGTVACAHDMGEISQQSEVQASGGDGHWFIGLGVGGQGGSGVRGVNAGSRMSDQHHPSVFKPV